MQIPGADAGDRESAPRSTDAAAQRRWAVRSRPALIAACLVAIASSFAAWAIIIWRNAHLHVGRFDFSAYYAAARALSLNPHADIYAPDVIASNALAGHVLAPPSLLFAYPPMPAILLVPLARLPFGAAADIFLALNEALCLLCLVLVANEVRHILGGVLAPTDAVNPTRHRAMRRLLADPSLWVAVAICAPLLLLSRPSTWTVGNGQVNFLVLLPLAAIPSLTRRGHERWVGVAVAVATMIKLTPIVLLAYLLLRRRWRAAGACVLTLAILAALCIGFIGPDVFFRFPQASLSIGSSDALEAHNEALVAPALRSLLLAAPQLSTLARASEYLVLGLLALVGGAILWLSRPTPTLSAARDATREETAAYVVAVCGMVLLSPTAWAHHYLWLLPAAALTVALAARRALDPGEGAHHRRGLLALGIALCAAVFLALPLPNGWDTDPATRQLLLFGLPLRPWLQELRPLGALLTAALAASFLPAWRGARPAEKTSGVVPAYNVTNVAR